MAVAQRLRFPLAQGLRVDPWRLRCFGLAAGCLALYLGGAGGYDLIDGDEARYAEAGRQMLLNGNWIIPEFNGVARFQKPILFYWLQAISQALFGATPWAARLPAALAGVGVILLTAWLGKALWGQRAGLTAGMVLAVTGAMVLGSRMVLTDVTLLLFIQGGIACFCMGQLQEDGRRARRFYRAMYASLALGALTKGPVALIIPGAVIGAWLLAGALTGPKSEVRCPASGDFGPRTSDFGLLAAIRRLHPLEGLAILLALAGPWYVAAHLQSGGAFTRHFFLYEYVTRYTTNVDEDPAGEPILFYWLLLLPLAFPWFGVVPQAIASGLRSRLRSPSFAEAAPWFMALQIALVMLLFTFSHTKIWTYTLAVFPALALLVGRWLAEQAEAREAGGSELRRRTPFSACLWPIAQIALALAVAATFLPTEFLPAPLRGGDFLGAAQVCSWTFTALAALLLAADRFAPPHAALGWLAGGIGAAYLVLYLYLFPALDRVWNQPVREVARAIRATPGAGAITYRMQELGLNFQARVCVVEHRRAKELSAVAARLSAPQPVFVLVPPKFAADLNGLRFHVWGRSNRFVYGANFAPPAHSASSSRLNPGGPR